MKIVCDPALVQFSVGPIFVEDPAAGPKGRYPVRGGKRMGSASIAVATPSLRLICNVGAAVCRLAVPIERPCARVHPCLKCV